MIPNNVLKVSEDYVRLIEPESLKKSGLVDYERGGVAIGDSSLGLDVYNWTLTVKDKYKAMLTRDGQASIQIYEYPTRPIDVAFCFDQSMNVVLAWQDNEFNLYLRKYSSSINAFEVIPFGSGKCPRLTLDEKRPEFIGNSDVIFAYVANKSLIYRVQREGYNIAHVVEDEMLASQRLARIGVKGFKLQMVLTPKG